VVVSSAKGFLLYAILAEPSDFFTPAPGLCNLP